MAQIGGSPYGFEDGQIIEYRACPAKLAVRFEFWNEQIAELVFEGFVGLRDHGALGATIGCTRELPSSDFINELTARVYERPPLSTGWTHYQFLDLDDFPVFEVLAERCVFSASRRGNDPETL